MRKFIIAALFAATAARAELIFEDGPLTIRLLSSQCSSEFITGALTAIWATGEPHRADAMRAGVFVPACWAFDDDGDVLVVDRSGAWLSIYRSAFEEDASGT